MSPLAQAIFELLPYLGALVFGALLVARRSWTERVGVGLVVLLAVVLATGLDPGQARRDAVAADEWPHLLNLIVFLPLGGALGLLLVPRRAPKLARNLTLLLLWADFAVSLLLLGTPMSDGWHFQYLRDWLPTLGIRYHVAVDGISLWLVLLTTLTTPLAAQVSFASLQGRHRELGFALLLLEGAMLGAFVALDLFLFYVFWELLLVPMFLLIGIWGGVDRIRAAYKFFLFTMTGSVLLLAALLYLVWWHWRLTGYLSFDYLALGRLVLPRAGAWLCFAAFAFAFLVKIPVFPLHTWLPDAHVEAPTGGSMVLAGVLLKLGAYGYARFCMGILGGPAYTAGPTLAGWAIGFGILYAALVCWKQSDFKRLVAYSSVAHMGFVMLGLFAASVLSVEGALLQMVNHGISTGGLFLLVGVLYDRRHTRDLSQFGGIARVMPVYASVLMVIALSSIGVPGTNGFVGELLVITGAFSSISLGAHGPVQGALAALGVIFAALYLLSALERVLFGPVRIRANRKLCDLRPVETLSVAPLIALVFVIGLFPRVLLGQMEPSVEDLVDRYRQARIAYLETPPEARQARLLPRRGGMRERGYPEPPSTQDHQDRTSSARSGLATHPMSTGRDQAGRDPARASASIVP